MQILKVFIKVKQNLKLEKELNVVEEVRTILFMRDLIVFHVHICSHIRTTQTNHKHHFIFDTARDYREVTEILFTLSMPYLSIGCGSHFYLLY